MGERPLCAVFAGYFIGKIGKLFFPFRIGFFDFNHGFRPVYGPIVVQDISVLARIARKVCEMLDISTRRFTAHPALTREDMSLVFQLRGRIFRGEGDHDDSDSYDASCTHILVKDTRTGQIVCTFRMNLVENAASLNTLYTNAFYDLAPLEKIGFPMLEIGRFCIDPSVNNPDILRLAWTVITRMVDTHGVTLMFGCSSFPTSQAAQYTHSLSLLQARYIGPEQVRPQRKAPDYIDLSTYAGDAFDQKSALQQMPNLLRTYLTMGGWVSDHAVVDHDLNTLHVFTGVEIANIPAARARALRAMAQT